MKNFYISSLIPVNAINMYELIKVMICFGYMSRLRKVRINLSEEIKPLMKVLKCTKIAFLYSTLSLLGICIQLKMVKLVNK